METGPSRKRLRRSTRSCYQCRQRKVKCQLTDEDVDTCAQCIKSGTECTLQPTDTGLSSRSPQTAADIQDNGPRLRRIETLLQKLLDAQGQPRVTEDSFQPDPMVPVSLWNEFLFQPAAGGSLPLTSEYVQAPQSTEEVPDAKKSLVALLPSAQDAAVIVTNTTAWLWGAETPDGSVLRPDDTIRLLDIDAISQGSTIHVAKTLLLFALYMQQLPSGFDKQILESQGVERAIELIVERVRLYVFSHEDDASSLDGLECLLLLSTVQLNDAAIRKAWMMFRRILDIARLRGLHNSFSLLERDSTSGETALCRRLWLSAVCGDCYCSLLLGLEPALGTAPFGPDQDTWNDPLADGDANVQRRVCLIIARVAQRNAVGRYQDRGILQEIDDALDKLSDSIPASWWKAPSFSPHRSLDSAKEPNRLICQMWFYQARMYAHIPIAFAQDTSAPSGSLDVCMEAARITLQRYVGLQNARDQLSRCRTVEQSVFVAAVVLALAKVQVRHHKTEPAASRYDSDQALLEQTNELFEAYGDCHREHVRMESSEILSALLRLAASDDILPPTKSSSSDPNSPWALGGSTEVRPATAKPGMEDILMSSIKPALDAHSPASYLICSLLASRQSCSGWAAHPAIDVNTDLTKPPYSPLLRL